MAYNPERGKYSPKQEKELSTLCKVGRERPAALCGEVISEKRVLEGAECCGFCETFRPKTCGVTV